MSILKRSGSVSTTYSDTRYAANHSTEKDEIMTTTNRTYPWSSTIQTFSYDGDRKTFELMTSK